jgi:predicted ABC-type sugar transport system permease subunit
MEATCSSETTLDIQRTTRRYIPEDRIQHVGYLIMIYLVTVSASHYVASNWRISGCYALKALMGSREPQARKP